MRNSDRANSVDADERKLREKRSVQKLLMAARKDLAAGNLQAARTKAARAKQFGVEYGLLDDRPELVLASVSAAARIGGTALRMNPQTARQPAAKESISQRPKRGISSTRLAPDLLAHRTNIRSNTPAGTRVSQSQRPFIPLPALPPADVMPSMRTTVSKVKEPPSRSASSEPSIGDADLPSASAQPTTAKPQVERDSRAAGFSDDLQSLAALFLVVIGVVGVGWMFWTRSRKVDVQSATSSAGQAKVLERMMRGELPIREQPLSLPPQIGVPRHSLEPQSPSLQSADGDQVPLEWASWTAPREATKSFAPPESQESISPQPQAVQRPPASPTVAAVNPASGVFGHALTNLQRTIQS